MTMEESEISWIEQSDVSGIWNAYPELTHFQIRGGNGLSLGRIDHPNLDTLIVEAGALDAKKGAEALLKSVRAPLLSRVDLHYHYLSDDMVERLRSAILGVDVSEQQED